MFNLKNTDLNFDFTDKSQKFLYQWQFPGRYYFR